MITKEFAEACTEINEIFKFLDESQVNKVPHKVRETFIKAQDKEYIPHIDPTKGLDNQDIKKKTKDILVNLYVNYWCSDEDRQEVNKILDENHTRKQLELRDKYNPDDIFKNKCKNNDEEKQLLLVEYKESIFKRMISRISKFFRR